MSTHRKRFSSPPQLHLLCHLPHRTLRPELHRNDPLQNGATMPVHRTITQAGSQASEKGIWDVKASLENEETARRRMQDETGRWRENLGRGLMRECARMYLLPNVSLAGANAIVGVFGLAANSPRKSSSSFWRGWWTSIVAKSPKSSSTDIVGSLLYVLPVSMLPARYHPRLIHIQTMLSQHSCPLRLSATSPTLSWHPVSWCLPSFLRFISLYPW